MDELQRMDAMLHYEKLARHSGFFVIAGIDEAGRGPLAGPVVAAACVLPDNPIFVGLNDSKKVSGKNRNRLFDEIIERAITYGIGFADHKEIDEINILNATKKAMERAMAQLQPQPDFLLLDAVELKSVPIKQQAIIKGDSLSFSIAAASILAKVTRDRLMVQLSTIYPQYNFAKHKGYGTKEHYEAIQLHGLCEIHRKTFTKGYW